MSDDAGGVDLVVLAGHLRSDGNALGLEPDRCGRARGATLPEDERELYHWILRRFASGEIPSRGSVAAAAEGLEVRVDRALTRMERLDLIERGADGSVRCAYPFSAVPTGHSVRLAGAAVPVQAMCAIDALGIPYMLHRAAEIEARDPTTGAAVRVVVGETGSWTATPVDAHVVVAAGVGDGPLASRCCPLVNLFASRHSAEAFLSERHVQGGAVLTVDEAIATGRAIFEGVLDEA